MEVTFLSIQVMSFIKKKNVFFKFCAHYCYICNIVKRKKKRKKNLCHWVLKGWRLFNSPLKTIKCLQYAPMCPCPFTFKSSNWHSTAGLLREIYILQMHIIHTTNCNSSLFVTADVKTCPGTVNGSDASSADPVKITFLQRYRLEPSSDTPVDFAGSNFFLHRLQL